MSPSSLRRRAGHRSGEPLGELRGLDALGQLGEQLELPRVVTGLSLYTHLPAMPVEHFDASPALL